MKTQKLSHPYNYYTRRIYTIYLPEKENEKYELMKKKKDHSWYREFDKKKRYQK